MVMVGNKRGECGVAPQGEGRKEVGSMLGERPTLIILNGKRTPRYSIESILVEEVYHSCPLQCSVLPCQ